MVQFISLWNDTIFVLFRHILVYPIPNKEKTAQLDEAVASLKAKTSEARKVIKLELPQASWKEFGINDVR